MPKFFSRFHKIRSLRKQATICSSITGFLANCFVVAARIVVLSQAINVVFSVPSAYRRPLVPMQDLLTISPNAFYALYFRALVNFVHRQETVIACHKKGNCNCSAFDQHSRQRFAFCNCCILFFQIVQCERAGLEWHVSC